MIDGRDPTTGKFLPGNPGGTGRERLPEWLTSRKADVLRFQFDAMMTGRISLAPPHDGEELEMTDDGQPVEAETTQVVPPAIRMDIAQRLADRLYGKAPQAVEEGQTSPMAQLLAVIATRQDDE